MIKTVFAEFFRVVSLKFFEHGSKGTSVHQLHEDPKTVLEIECLIALYYRFTLSHLHDTNLVLDRLAFSSALGLCELQGEELSITDSHAAEDSGEATLTLFTDDLVELRWILLLNICMVGDLTLDLSAIFQLLLG